MGTRSLTARQGPAESVARPIVAASSNVVLRVHEDTGIVILLLFCELLRTSCEQGPAKWSRSGMWLGNRMCTKVHKSTFIRTLR